MKAVGLRSAFRRNERRLDAMAADLRALKKRNAAMESVLRQLQEDQKQQRKNEDAVRNMATAPVMAEVEAFVAARQLSMRETLRLVGDERMSFARFGDGELRQIVRPTYNLKFQPWREGLSTALREVLTTPQPGLLVGFPQLFHDAHWQLVWSDVWRQIKPMLDGQPHFGNSHVSRPICFTMLDEEGAELWRRVWSGRDVTLITGAGSRFVPVPQLFDGVRSWTRVDSEPVDAFRDLERVLDEVDKLDPENLHLLALGPTATVAASELAKRGRWAIDVGHISSSYVHVFLGGEWPEQESVRSSQDQDEGS